MTLVGRTSVFFLGVLAVALAAFTAGLYFLARADRYREVDQRLTATLASLSGALETNRRGFQWDAREHPLAVGIEDGPEHVRWLITSGDGDVIAESENLQFDEGDDKRKQLTDPPYEALAEHGLVETEAERWANTPLVAGDPWRVTSMRLEAADPRPPSLGKASSLHPVLVLTSGLNLRPVRESLDQLLIWSIGLSVGLWGAAVLLGRWICRRAIAPLTEMAVAARRMSTESLDERLPSPGTADELHDLSQAFNDLLGRVQNAFERQRRFTSEASHQLRTPLTALLGQVEVALRHDRGGEAYRETLRRVERQTRRLTQLVEALLFLARADADTDAHHPDCEPLDLAGWLRDYLPRWREHARGADIELIAPNGLPKVLAHAPLLEQLLDNLLDNAGKYSPPGTPIRVRLRSEQVTLSLRDRQADERNNPATRCVILSVEDRGKGIAAEELPRLFEPFFRAAEARRQGVEGMGLGLAVVKRIADALGCNLQVESRIGQGTTFCVVFPAGDASASRSSLINRNAEMERVESEGEFEVADLANREVARLPA